MWGQTYTTTGNSTNWNSTSAWFKTNPDGCGTQNNSGIPPLGPVWSPNCQIKIVINHPITNSSGNVNIGGGLFHSVTVNSGGALTFSGNLSINNSGGNNLIVNVNTGGQFIVNNQFNLTGIAAISIRGLLSANSISSSNIGSTSLNIYGNGELKTTGKLTVNNYAINSFDNGKISIGGDLDITSSGPGSVNIRGNSNVTVTGQTTISSPMRIYDQSLVTFQSNVNLPNTGEAKLETHNEADVLIQGNLSIGNSGWIRTYNSSSLVICDARLPAGTVTGAYPLVPGPNSNVSSSGTSYYGGCRILPVEFLSFNVTYQPQHRSALIDWSTAKEWENSHFEIERAVNSVKEWETIGRVEGNGYSDGPVEYSFTDTDLPKTGGNIFYRLKQLDFSGKYSYSRTRAIQVDAIDSKSVWVAYPNPSTIGSEISVELLQLNQYQDELISLRLVNMLGEGESTMLTSPEDISLVVSEWLLSKKAGLYILDIRWGANAQQLKLLRN